MREPLSNAAAKASGMADLWDQWDRRVRDTGRPSRVASDLTDAELVRLLAAETKGRAYERRVLCDELFMRLNRLPGGGSGSSSQRFPPEVATWPHLGPEAGP